MPPYSELFSLFSINCNRIKSSEEASALKNCIYLNFLVKLDRIFSSNPILAGFLRPILSGSQESGVKVEYRNGIISKNGRSFAHFSLDRKCRRAR